MKLSASGILLLGLLAAPARPQGAIAGTQDGLDPAAERSETPADPIEQDSESGRILGVIPDNKIVPSQRTSIEEPLTRREKFGLAFKDTIDPYTFVLAGFYAGIAQWENDYSSWKQGGAGYGRRFGAAYADQGVGNFLTEAIVPALLREDPRYFRKGTGGAWARFNYALTRTVIIRTDRSRNEFNYSEVVGNAAAAGISNLYYPRPDRTIGETGEKFAIQIVSDSAFNVLLEFWPDMRRALEKRSPFKH